METVGGNELCQIPDFSLASVPHESQMNRILMEVSKKKLKLWFKGRVSASLLRSHYDCDCCAVCLIVERILQRCSHYTKEAEAVN